MPVTYTGVLQHQQGPPDNNKQDADLLKLFKAPVLHLILQH